MGLGIIQAGIFSFASNPQKLYGYWVFSHKVPKTGQSGILRFRVSISGNSRTASFCWYLQLPGYLREFSDKETLCRFLIWDKVCTKWQRVQRGKDSCLPILLLTFSLSFCLLILTTFLKYNLNLLYSFKVQNSMDRNIFIDFLQLLFSTI